MEAPPLPGLPTRPPLITTIPNATITMKSVITDMAHHPQRQQKPKSNSPFAIRHGRRYCIDESVVYPLPNDVKELSRQALVHEMTCELVGGLHCSDIPDDKIPKKVLDLGCGTAIWSAAMSDEFARRGFPDVEFIGVDIVPVYTDMKEVNFKFVQCDFMKQSLPFPDHSLDMVMCRDIALACSSASMFVEITSEIERILKPGGIFECYVYDTTMRALQRTQVSLDPRTGVYPISPNTHFSSSENPYIQQYNERLTVMLTNLNLATAPTAQVVPSIVMYEKLSVVFQSRMAIPLDDIWWESNTDGSSTETSPSASISSSDKRKSTSDSSMESLSSSPQRLHRRHRDRSSTTTSNSNAGSHPSPLTDQQRAIRALARLTWLQLIEALEPNLRVHNGIDSDEWERWYRDLFWNAMENQGLRSGECIEFGVFCGRKNG